MAIYCSFPNCKNGPGNVTERVGFYKFPLTDRVREQQWLKNMDYEKWAPCHPYYICEEHFSPSSFIVQWCVRHISNEVVPTVIHKGQKRKATEYIEKKAKQPRVEVTESIEVDKMSDEGSLERSVEDYLKQVKDGLTGASSFLGDSDEGEGDNADEGEGDETHEGEGDNADEGEGDETEEEEGDETDEGEGDETDEGEGEETVSDEDSIEYQDQQPEEHCTDQLQAIIADLQKNVQVLQQREHQQRQKLAVLEEQAICLRQTAALAEERLQMLEKRPQQKALYPQHVNSATEQFSTVLGVQDIQPFTFPNNSAQRNSTADTVLSNHVPPMPEIVVIRDNGLDSDSDEGEGDHRKSEIIMECNSQLEEEIADLQKSVKVLQQQDRQRLERCMVLENAVSQLEQHGAMKAMRLQLLERKRKATEDIGNPSKRRRLDRN